MGDPPLATMVETWIRKFRPRLATSGNLVLFPGIDVRSITQQGMRQAVEEVTHEFVGVKITPHQFRHLNAVAFLKEHSGQYEMVRQMLNHATVTTTVKAYCGAEQDDVHALFDSFKEVRQQAAKVSPRRSHPRPRQPPRGYPAQPAV